jgi:hypothetical protein
MKLQHLALGALSAVSLALVACSSSDEGGGAEPPTAVPPLDFSQTQNRPNQPAANGQGGSGSQVANTNNGQGGQSNPAPQATGGQGGAANGAGGAPALGNPTTSLLTPNAELWVARATNSVGIQGAFFKLSDESGTTTVSEPALNATGAICTRGTVGQVVGMDFQTTWGGGIGFNLSDPGGGATGTENGQPWDRAGGRVRSFSFQVSGPTVPTGLRFVAIPPTRPAGVDSYCVAGVSGNVTQTIESIDGNCWDAAVAPLGTTLPLVSIQWVVPAETTGTVPFDFCISNVTAVVQ